MATLKLTRGAATLLKQVLLVPDAVTNPKDKFAAGEILDLLASLPPFKGKKVEELEKWAMQNWKSIEINDNQRKVLGTMVLHCSEKGIMPNGAHYNSIAKQLGIVD